MEPHDRQIWEESMWDKHHKQDAIEEYAKKLQVLFPEELANQIAKDHYEQV